MGTVLIVDDDADHRELMARFLRHAGHRVILAPDPDSARSVLLGGGVDAVVADLRMPGESGIEFCRRLRTEMHTALLPALLVSAADLTTAGVRAALRAGADDFMVKPFRRAELCERVERLLRMRPELARRAPAACRQEAVI